MGFNRRDPRYRLKPLRPDAPARHYDAPQSGGAMEVARAGYEVVDQSRPYTPFDPLMPERQQRRDLGEPVFTGPDRTWDSTTIGIEK
jgi:hypothetical protein